MEPFCKQLHHACLTFQLVSFSLHSSPLPLLGQLPLFLRRLRWKSAQFDSVPEAVITLLMCSFLRLQTCFIFVVSSSSPVPTGLIHLRSRQIYSMKSTVAALAEKQLPLDLLRNFGCLEALRLLLQPVL